MIVLAVAFVAIVVALLAAVYALHRDLRALHTDVTSGRAFDRAIATDIGDISDELATTRTALRDWQAYVREQGRLVQHHENSLSWLLAREADALSARVLSARLAALEVYFMQPIHDGRVPPVSDAAVDEMVERIVALGGAGGGKRS